MVDLNLQVSEVLHLSDISIDIWIAINLRFKTIMITKDKFVIVYNEKSLEEHKERLILSHLGFDTDNEKGDEWVPDDEEESDSSKRIQVVEMLNTCYEIYSSPYEHNPYVPDEPDKPYKLFSHNIR